MSSLRVHALSPKRMNLLLACAWLSELSGEEGAARGFDEKVKEMHAAIDPTQGRMDIM